MGRACVYATGSFARGEATSHSDLDLFIVGDHEVKEERVTRVLPYLDEICVKADLIEMTEECRIPKFSGDGQYLTHYTVHALVATLGTSEDDAHNTFTARLLLLLESKPLLGDEFYWKAITDVIAAYWRDFADHSKEFIPAFLTNDILRLWRTFCVNYEARTKTGDIKEKAKRQLKNYKLKHSRMLTCYSGLVFLLAVFVKQKTVTPDDVCEMVRLTPTNRLAWLAKQDANWKSQVNDLLSKYEKFLERTDASEEALVAQFMDPAAKKEFSRQANEFGDGIFNLLLNLGMSLGEKNLLLRHLVV